MNLTLKQKYLAGSVILLFLLIITNPSVKAFKDYVGSSTYHGLHKDKNFFILSIYKYRQQEYVGCIGNFWKERYEETKPYVPTTTTAIDSSKKDTSRAEDDLLPPPPKKVIVGHTKDGLPIYNKY